MNYSAFSRLQTRRVPWEVLAALCVGGVIFVVLLIAAGDVLISFITAVAVIGLFGLVHYLIWGQTSLKNTAAERRQEEAQTRLQVEQAAPIDEFSLVLNDRERAALMSVLEQSLAEAPAQTHQSPPGNGRQSQQQATIREVLDRLRKRGMISEVGHELP